MSNISEQVQSALIKHEYKMVEPRQLAEEYKFTSDELTMLDIFWQPAYNSDWLYLSPDLILNKMGYKKISDFYNIVLRSNYIENQDYKEVDEKYKKVIEYYENPNAIKIALGKLKHTGGKTKKHYLITGKTLKKMLMKCGTSEGDKICEYYIKVEQLAMFMKDYIIAIKEREYQQKIESMLIYQNNVRSFIEDTKELEKNTTIYIATSKIYANQNLFKIGHIANISKKSLKARLANYNVGKTGNDTFYFCYIKEVSFANLLDSRIKVLLSRYKYNKNKEMIKMHYTLISKFVDYVSENHDDDCDYVNKMLEEYKNGLNQIPIIPEPIELVDQHQLELVETKDNVEVKREFVDIKNLTDEQKRAKITEVLSTMIKQDDTKFVDFKTTPLTERKVIAWTDIKNKLIEICGIAERHFKPRAWKQQIPQMTNIKIKG